MEELRYGTATGRRGSLRAVLYARVSTDEQAQRGYSIPDQMRELRVYAEREGLEVVDEIVDDGYSGASPDRPGLRRVMELAEAGETDLVLALKRNRLFRSRLYRLLCDRDLKDLGVELRALDDTGNRFGDAMTDEFAEYEREAITERTMRGRLQKARSGKLIPAHSPGATATATTRTGPAWWWTQKRWRWCSASSRGSPGARPSTASPRA